MITNTPCDIRLPDAEVRFYPQLFTAPEADRLFETLLAETDWTQEQIKICGKTIDIPRLTAWCGDPGKVYTYSGIRLRASPWTPALAEIKERVEKLGTERFNSVLLNRYRNGADSVAWHSDDEPELGKNPPIGSVSLGAQRKFQMKHKTDHTQKLVNIPLTHGSYLLMRGATQHHWRHQLPKTKKPVGERINLTFRTIRDWGELEDSR